MKQTEEYYYGRMPKDKQNVYRAMLHGLMELSDEFLIPQVPTTDGNWLYDVFFPSFVLITRRFSGLWGLNTVITRTRQI